MCKIKYNDLIKKSISHKQICCRGLTTRPSRFLQLDVLLQIVAHILVRAVVLGALNLVVSAAPIIQSQTLVYCERQRKHSEKRVKHRVTYNTRSLLRVARFGSGNRIQREPDKCFPPLSMLSFSPVLAASLTVNKEEQMRNVVYYNGKR